MTPSIDISAMKHIYFIGIGGIGMSALARYFLHEGVRVSGYDRDDNTLTRQLMEEGMDVHFEDRGDDLPEDLDLVVYTPAIPDHHGELSYLRSTVIPVLKRSEALKELFWQKRVIGVAGTHGKTSTSAILAHVLHSQGFAMTAFIGGILKNYDSNFIYGDSDWVVVEADEYDRSFLRLYPEIAVVQAMDADHLDIYGEKSAMIDSFRAYTDQIREGGVALIRQGIGEFWSQSEWQKSLSSKGIDVKGFGQEAEAAVRWTDYHVEDGWTVFTIHHAGELQECRMLMAGAHNINNATAAAGVALHLGLSLEQVAAGLESFRGIERRFEVLRHDTITIVDDYAHHPVEIDAAISAARMQYPNRHLTVVFQPHLFTRTRDFQEGFAEALDQADDVVLLPIYSAREEPIDGVTTEIILDRMQSDSKRLLSKEKMIDYLDREKIDVLLTLGAGDINKLLSKILLKLE